MQALEALNAERFDELRRRRGVTRREIARAAHVDETQLSQALSGKRRLRLTTIRRLAAAMDSFPEIPQYVRDLLPTNTKNAAASTSAASQEAGVAGADIHPEV